MSPTNLQDEEFSTDEMILSALGPSQDDLIDSATSQEISLFD